MKCFKNILMMHFLGICLCIYVGMEPTIAMFAAVDPYEREALQTSRPPQITFPIAQEELIERIAETLNGSQLQIALRRLAPTEPFQRWLGEMNALAQELTELTHANLNVFFSVEPHPEGAHWNETKQKLVFPERHPHPFRVASEIPYNELFLGRFSPTSRNDVGLGPTAAEFILFHEFVHMYHSIYKNYLSKRKIYFSLFENIEKHLPTLGFFGGEERRA